MCRRKWRIATSWTKMEMAEMKMNTCIFFFWVLFNFFNVYLSIWLCQVLTEAHEIFDLSYGTRIFSCNMWTHSGYVWDLVPWPRTEPGPSDLGVWSLRHWVTKENPIYLFLYFFLLFFYWNLAYLQYCVSFRWKGMWSNYIYVTILFIFFSLRGYYKLLSYSLRYCSSLMNYRLLQIQFPVLSSRSL